MPWYSRRPGPVRALTAAAQPVKGPQSQFLQRTQGWQNEVWRYFDEVGELNYGIMWLANMLSRVRLKAAQMVPGVDEPAFVDSGPVADAIAALGSGIGGQSQIMRSLAVQMSLPGDCYLVGEQSETTQGSSVYDWCVRSVDEVRVQTDKFQVVADRIPTIEWEDLPPNSMPVRIWRPHARFYHLADSPARSALPILRELELVNRHIMAQYLSRLASAGVLVIPSEIEFPVREEFQDAPDPFTAEWIEIAAEAIKTPGTASAVIPIPMKVPAEMADAIRHIDFTLKLDDQIIEKRASAINRLATKLDLPTEVLTGLGKVNHWCVDDQTEILTTRGWLREPDLKVGDVALTLNHETGLSEWQPVRYVYRAPVENEPMVAIDRVNHSSLTTPHHRWAVTRIRKRDGVPYVSREFVHSEDLRREHSIVTAAVCADIPSEAKYTDDLVELVAWLWTEGHVKGRGVSIAQSHTRNPERVERIRSCLTRLYGPPKGVRGRMAYPSWRECVQVNETSYGGPVTVFHLNQHAAAPLLEIAPGKLVRSDFIRELTRAQLDLFIGVSCFGDGWHHRSGRQDIWQRDPRALDAYELALVLSGRMVRNGESSGGRYVSPWKGTGVRPMKSVNGAHDAEYREYTGTVWCPVTENSTWLARRNGTVYYTGNTAWQLDEASLKTHIAPLVETICDSLTRGYLRPRLSQSGIDVADFVVWYDLSELAIRPDRSANAVEVYDRLELSGAALRRETGFNEDDAPTQEELAQQGLKLLARTVPNAAPSAIDQLAGKKVLDIEAGSPAGSGTGGNTPSAPEKAEPAVPGPPGQGASPPSQKAPSSKAPASNPPSTAPPKTHSRSLEQLQALHAVRFDIQNPAGLLLHPPGCAEHAYSCPFTHTWLESYPARLTTGTYEARIDTWGKLVIGQPTAIDTWNWIPTRTSGVTGRKLVNGHAR